MVIQEKDFLLEYDEDNNRFDLSLLYVKNAKNPEKRVEEFKIYGYGMTLDSCLSTIINIRISKKFTVLTLKEYLKEYRELVSEVRALLPK